jgi:predicted permease
MSLLKGLRARLRSILRARDAEARMDEEFRFHVEMETKRLVDQGIDADEAHRRARAAFGGADQHREAMRDGRGARLFDDLRADVRFALRAMRRKPGFALATALTLGIGIGINGVIFGFVNSLLLRPLPARDADQLVGVFTMHTKSGEPDLVAYDDYIDLRDRSGVFEDVAGRTDGPLNLVMPRGTAGGGAASSGDIVWGEFVTENYFSLLGVRPALGRFFTAADAPQGANAFAVLSYPAWRGRFNSDSGVIGRVVRLNGTPFTIVAVAPRGFRGIRTFGFWPEVWAPIGMHNALLPGSTRLLQGRGEGWMMVVGRMHPAATRQSTEGALTSFAAQLERDHPASNREIGLLLVPGATGFDHPGFVKPAVLQLSSALGMVAAIITLLIVCANLANLQLARSAARDREIAIRLSLGCSRRRLTRQLLVECVVLAIPGALLAIVAVYFSVRIESLMVPRLQFRVGFDPTVDMRVIAYTGAVALLSVLLFGLVPALRASRPGLTPSLTSVVGRRRTSAAGGKGMRSSLVVTQLAMAVVLLVAGTLFVRSLTNARAMDLGFDPQGRAIMSVDLGLQGYDAARGRRFYGDVIERLQGNAAIVSATWAFPAPFDTYDRSIPLYSDELPGNADDQTIRANATFTDIDFEKALGLQLQAGRVFTKSDSNGTPAVMVVSRRFATQYWPGRDPVGQRVRIGGPSGAEISVIGVVADAKFTHIGDRNLGRVYIPLRQNFTNRQTLIVHARGNPALVDRTVRDLVATLDPDLPTFGSMTMQESVASGLATYQTAAGTGAFFGLFALLIASIGLYAVVAEGVAARTREIGVRVALGATPRGVMHFIMGSGARLGLVGLAIGVASALGVVTLMRGLLYGLSPHDPLTFVAVPLVLGIVVFVATYLPARRAVRLDPVSALRTD